MKTFVAKYSKGILVRHLTGDICIVVIQEYEKASASL